MKQLILLDVCPSDYFTGHNLPVISVSVSSSTTVEELIEGIEQEYEYCFDFYEEQYSEADFDSAITALREKNKDILSMPFLLNPEEVEEEEEEEGDYGLYAHFVLGRFTSTTFAGIQCNFAE